MALFINTYFVNILYTLQFLLNEMLLDSIAELQKSLSELYLSFNKLTVLDPCIGQLDRLLILDVR